MDNKIKFPQFKLEVFFSGKVEAFGHMILFFPKKRVDNIKATFDGNFRNSDLHLKEEYFDGNLKIKRIWIFKKTANNDYIGYEKNVKGSIKVHSRDNILEMSYKFNTHYKCFNFLVNIRDYMYLIDDKTLINKSVISKFGFTIGETILIYKKL